MTFCLEDKQNEEVFVQEDSPFRTLN